MSCRRGLTPCAVFFVVAFIAYAAGAPSLNITSTLQQSQPVVADVDEVLEVVVSVTENDVDSAEDLLLTVSLPWGLTLFNISTCKGGEAEQPNCTFDVARDSTTDVVYKFTMDGALRGEVNVSWELENTGGEVLETETSWLVEGLVDIAVRLDTNGVTSFSRGDKLAWSAIIDNAGPSAALNVTATLTASRPPGEVLVLDPSCDIEGDDEITCLVDQINKNASVTLDFVTEMVAYTGFLNLTAVVSSDEVETNTTDDDTDVLTLTALGPVDMELILVNLDGDVGGNTTVEFEVTVRLRANSSDADEAQLEITLSDAPDMSFEGAITSDPSNITCSMSDFTITCPLGDDYGGDPFNASAPSDVFRFHVRTNDYQGEYTVTATFSTTTPLSDDSVATNAVSAEAYGTADVSVAISADSTSYEPTENATISVFVSASSNYSDGRGVEVTLNITGGSSSTSWFLAPGCSEGDSSSIMICVLETIPAGTTSDLELRVAVGEEEVENVTFTATITNTLSFDPNDEEHEASVVAHVRIVVAPHVITATYKTVEFQAVAHANYGQMSDSADSPSAITATGVVFHLGFDEALVLKTKDMSTTLSLGELAWPTRDSGARVIPELLGDVVQLDCDGSIPTFTDDVDTLPDHVGHLITAIEGVNDTIAFTFPLPPTETPIYDLLTRNYCNDTCATDELVFYLLLAVDFHDEKGVHVLHNIDPEDCTVSFNKVDGDAEWDILGVSSAKGPVDYSGPFTADNPTSGCLFADFFDVQQFLIKDPLRMSTCAFADPTDSLKWVAMQSLDSYQTCLRTEAAALWTRTLDVACPGPDGYIVE